TNPERPSAAARGDGRRIDGSAHRRLSYPDMATSVVATRVKDQRRFHMSEINSIARCCRTVAISVALSLIVSQAAKAEVRFLDHRDKVIVLETPPKKLVSMFASGPLVYFAVDGGSEHIAGVRKDGIEMYRGSIYSEIIPEF